MTWQILLIIIFLLVINHDFSHVRVLLKFDQDSRLLLSSRSDSEILKIVLKLAMLILSVIELL